MAATMFRMRNLRSTPTARFSACACIRSRTSAPIRRHFGRSCRHSLYGPLLSGQYNIPAIYVRSRRGLYEHRVGRRRARRGPAGGDLPDRAHRRKGRAGDRTRSGRVSAQELRHLVPASDARHFCLRRRRLWRRRSTRRSSSPTTRAWPPARRLPPPRASCAASGFSAYIEACGLAPSQAVGRARHRRRANGNPPRCA